jgi:predicted secreted protein
MATPLFSKLINIKIDSSTVACATEFSLSMNKDMIEIACLSSTGAKTTVPDMYGWSVSGSGLVFRTVGSTGYGVFNMANSLLASDASVLVQIIPDVSLNQYFSGAGYFTSLTYEGGVGAAITYSFEVTGDGVLSVLTTT